MNIGRILTAEVGTKDERKGISKKPLKKAEISQVLVFSSLYRGSSRAHRKQYINA